MKITSDPTTEEELDRRIAEAQARRVANAAQAERYGYYADQVCLVLLLCAGGAHVLVPAVAPQVVADQILYITTRLWMLLPCYLLGVLISRIGAYRAKRREVFLHTLNSL